VQLFDLKNDPDETTNLASKPEQTERVKELTTALEKHLTATAREPKFIPNTPDVHERLAHLLQPRDVK